MRPALNLLTSETVQKIIDESFALLEKLNTLAIENWKVMYCQPKDLCTMQTIEFLKRSFEPSLKWSVVRSDKRSALSKATVRMMSP